MNWIPDWLLRLFGRKIADKLDLQEGTLDGTKPWYQSKTIIASIVTAVMGLYLAIAPQFHWPTVPEWLFTILGAIGVYSRVTADSKIG